MCTARNVSAAAFQSSAVFILVVQFWRRLDIPMGQQTYRAVKVKRILLVTTDQKTKNVIKYNKDLLFQHILNYIILY